jgi:hypothetical protein
MTMATGDKRQFFGPPARIRAEARSIRRAMTRFGSAFERLDFPLFGD